MNQVNVTCTTLSANREITRAILSVILTEKPSSTLKNDTKQINFGFRYVNVYTILIINNNRKSS